MTSVHFFLTVAGLSENVQGGVFRAVRRAIVIGNGCAGAENQCIGLVRSLGLVDRHLYYSVARPRGGGINRWLQWLSTSLFKRLDHFISSICAGFSIKSKMPVFSIGGITDVFEVADAKQIAALARRSAADALQVLERDLAIFGFFIALGRSTQSFLAANGFNSLENPAEDLVRHFIGGSLLQYPQLSAISSYQLYVEVVCEELEWLPFYPNKKDSQPAEQAHGHRSRPQGPPNYDALPQILNVCSYWLQSFIKYSKWPENPSNVKAAKFLSKGHNKLIQCKEKLGISSLAVTEAGFIDMNAFSTDKESSSFDKALESVDEALVRLESLLQQLHASSSSSGKEQIKAACSDLEKIRKLKKEAEFLEASFRAKAASLQEGDGDTDSQESSEEQKQNLKGNETKNSFNSVDQGTRNRGFWGFFDCPPKRKPAPKLLVFFNYLSYVQTCVKHISDLIFCWRLISQILGVSNLVFTQLEDAFLKVSRFFYNMHAEKYTERSTENEPNEIYRFELLRNELIELEKRVQGSTYESVNGEVVLKMINVDASTLRTATLEWKDEFASLSKPLVVVNIGGPTKYPLELWKPKNIFLQKNTEEEYITIVAEQMVAEVITGEMRSNSKVYIWDGKEPNPHLGHLALADAFIITADSISMLSEACTTGKPVYVVGAERCTWKFSTFRRPSMKEELVDL
ncbi:unnamed protein product [Thlaspi arvense]|uniref:Uncharacterized protein n=1 Tax=Thlaspi arvense TaxID=13288 RepID=A0AAU9T060_THLAR|nr:unnamed protein product [Thlaspi arvense]